MSAYSTSDLPVVVIGAGPVGLAAAAHLLEQGLEPLIGHGVTAVRCVGLWAGVDIAPALATGRQVSERLMARGILVKDTHGSTIRLAPPLVVTAAELTWVVDQLAEVLAELALANARTTAVNGE